MNGFTILEILLSFALIAVIFGIAMPVYQGFQIRNDLDIAANEFVQSLRRAQVLSQAVEGDSSWGAKIQSGNIVLFKGSSYAGRDQNFDEVIEIPSNIAISGNQEIIFNKLTGFPQTIGTTALTSINNETKNIIINEKGTITF